MLSGRRPEVGLLPVELTPEGRDDPRSPASRSRSCLSSGTATRSTSRRLGAAGALTSVPNQAFRAAERAYGVQFHLEVTGEMAREWAEVPAYQRSLADTLGEEDGARFIADVERRADELHPAARRLFANWLDLAG